MQLLRKSWWQDEDGALSFEWSLVIVLLVFGIIGGLGAARDAVIDELGDSAEAILQWDQSYSFVGVPALGIPASEYIDSLGTVTDCARSSAIPLAPQNDAADGG
jgi:Flp pilus assembly pilin Flp